MIYALCSRAMRNVAIGRKNWLLAGGEGGGKAAAIALTLIGERRAPLVRARRTRQAQWR